VDLKPVPEDRPLDLRAEEAGTTPASQLEAVFRAFPSLLFFLDLQGKILDFKVSDPALLFLPGAALLGKSMQQILPREAEGKFESALEEVRNTGQITALRFALETPRGSLWFDARLLLASRSRIYLAMRDVTEHVQTAERARLQLRQMAALHSIDAAISASFNLNVTLSVILRETVNLLGVDAADVLLLRSHFQTLEFAAGQGFRSPFIQTAPMLVGQGFAGAAVLQRRTVSIPDAGASETDYLRLRGFAQEGFVSYFAVPLIAKAQVKGVLEIFHRSPLRPDEAWLDFLYTLSAHAAMAIDSAYLFLDLQRSNAELGLAYDAVIDSWSQLLEVSGRESSEHIQNVIRLSVKLAQLLGVSGADMIHVRRGALLHDIGEIGIPESILGKAGLLSPEEWQVVKKHPRLAAQILSSAPYLASAILIPVNHHENWDGSGYPEGLRGEQIPLLARLFSVVDVYDSMTSPRPYREAWPAAKALEYIQEQSGKKFDPAVVHAFLQLASGSGLNG
jgi:HD-GYP domain-containing protein (c-di-GMP phosphodiesterase class II)